MILLNATDISKSYTEIPLLERLSLGIHEGDKLGFIGVNGTGKSTFLRILAGVEDADSGTVTLTGGVRVSYLPQMPDFKEDLTILEYVMKKAREIRPDVEEYECKAMLNRLNLQDHDRSVKKLSGGEKKRAAMASIFVNPAELLILDEPTNHIDSQLAQWLEDYLVKYKGALFMVTHDRYFLDRVVNKIAELNRGKLHIHEGNYSAYLAGKAEREDMLLATERKRKTLYQRELAWIRRGAQARSTKAKSRIERFQELEKSKYVVDDSSVSLQSVASRLGKKVISLEGVSKTLGDRKLIDNFTYTVLRRDRIGIIGPNGSGKSTLLKIITGQIQPDEGSVEIGETVRIGYFAQENEPLNPDLRMLDYIQTIAYNVTTTDGTISASQMLERFLFPTHTHSVKVGRLSGGEQRRLYLAGLLMQAPNVLLFDEPTNDLDIDTLTVLEDYLETFPGAVIVVSHDRYLLDRIAIRTFAYEGSGQIGHYPGGYSDYMEIRSFEEEEQAANDPGEKKQKPAATEGTVPSRKTKLSYHEQREFDTIEEDIAAMEERVAALEADISAAGADYVKLTQLTEEKNKLEEALSAKMDRWMYLTELADQFAK